MQEFRYNDGQFAGLQGRPRKFATRGSRVRIPSAPSPPQEAKPMNTMTARALMVGVLIAIWAWLASVARLNVSMWAGVVALGCFYASGGGVAGGGEARGAGGAGGGGGVRGGAGR